MAFILNTWPKENKFDDDAAYKENMQRYLMRKTEIQALVSLISSGGKIYLFFVVAHSIPLRFTTTTKLFISLTAAGEAGDFRVAYRLMVT